MGIFWKSFRKKGIESAAGADTDVDQVAKKLAFKLLSVQRHLADRVNAYVRKVKVRVLLAVMVSLGTAFGIYCLYLVLSAFF